MITRLFLTELEKVITYRPEQIFSSLRGGPNWPFRCLDLPRDLKTATQVQRHKRDFLIFLDCHKTDKILIWCDLSISSFEKNCEACVVSTFLNKSMELCVETVLCKVFCLWWKEFLTAVVLSSIFNIFNILTQLLVGRTFYHQGHYAMMIMMMLAIRMMVRVATTAMMMVVG